MEDKNKDKFLSFAEKTNQEVRWWMWAAWTLPFVALAGIFFLEVIGWGSWIEKAVILGATIFFAIAVYWWWWAIYKMSTISDLLVHTATNIKGVGREIRQLKEDLLSPNDK